MTDTLHDPSISQPIGLNHDSNICAKCRGFVEDTLLEEHAKHCQGPGDVPCIRWYTVPELTWIHHETVKTNRMFHDVSKEYLLTYWG